MLGDVFSPCEQTPGALEAYELVHGGHPKLCHQQMPSAIRTQQWLASYHTDRNKTDEVGDIAGLLFNTIVVALRTEMCLAKSAPFKIVRKFKTRFPCTTCTQCLRVSSRSNRPQLENLTGRAYLKTVTTGSTYIRNIDISVMFPLRLGTKDPGSLMTVSLIYFEEYIRSPSNLLVPCAPMIQMEKLWS